MQAGGRGEGCLTDEHTNGKFYTVDENVFDWIDVIVSLKSGKRCKNRLRGSRELNRDLKMNFASNEEEREGE